VLQFHRLVILLGGFKSIHGGSVKVFEPVNKFGRGIRSIEKERVFKKGVMKIASFSAPELLRLIALGDEQALAALYDRYRAILFGLLLRVLHNREEAEDVLQEVFMQVWQCAANFDESRSKPFTGLVTLARSLAIKRLRFLGSCSMAAVEASSEIFDCSFGRF
jgi:hypothetical protein